MMLFQCWFCIHQFFLQDLDGEEAEMSDWERYAAEEYEILVAEEGANEMQNDEM